MSLKRKRRNRVQKVVKNKNGQSKTSRYLEDKLTIMKLFLQLVKVACDTYDALAKLWESLDNLFY